MLIEVLQEPVVARRRNVEDTDVALADTFPEPPGVENGGTCLSIQNIRMNGLIVEPNSSKCSRVYDYNGTRLAKTYKQAPDIKLGRMPKMPPIQFPGFWFRTTSFPVNFHVPIRSRADARSDW